MYKIQLINKISPLGLAKFDPEKYSCSENIENPDAMIVRSASMHDMDIPASVQAIARAGAGVNNVPVERCGEKGIVVFNTPGANANAVKELTIAALLLSARRIVPSMQWAQGLKGQGDAVPAAAEKGKSQFTGPELKGKKLGVIGLGAIGVLVCNAARHFGMEVYGYDPFISVKAAWNLSSKVNHAASLGEIYEKCDFISLHLPLNAETRGMINTASINTMKDNVRILNFARAELVNTADIISAVESKKVYCYLTDFATDELLGHENILVLPHLGASTPESEENCAEMAAEEIRDYLENGNIRNSVNMPELSAPRTPGTSRIGLLYNNLPDTLSLITGVVGQDVGSLASNSRGSYAYTLIDLDSAPDSKTLDALKAIDGVLRVTAY